MKIQISAVIEMLAQQGGRSNLSFPATGFLQFVVCIKMLYNTLQGCSMPTM